MIRGGGTRQNGYIRKLIPLFFHQTQNFFGDIKNFAAGVRRADYVHPVRRGAGLRRKKTAPALPQSAEFALVGIFGICIGGAQPVGFKKFLGKTIGGVFQIRSKNRNRIERTKPVKKFQLAARHIVKPVENNFLKAVQPVGRFGLFQGPFKGLLVGAESGHGGLGLQVTAVQTVQPSQPLAVLLQHGIGSQTQVFVQHFGVSQRVGQIAQTAFNGLHKTARNGKPVQPRLAE